MSVASHFSQSEDKVLGNPESDCEVFGCHPWKCRLLTDGQELQFARSFNDILDQTQLEMKARLGRRHAGKAEWTTAQTQSVSNR